jgi:nucleotide-binding universal stress UspA family protein
LTPTPLGLVTIILSAIALASAVAWERRGGRVGDRRLATVLAFLVPAGVCFTTIGRLWYLPGALLIIAGVLVVGASARGELSHAVSRHHWLNGLTALLGGYFLFLGGDALPKAVGVLGILGALAIWTALLGTRRSHRVRLILLAVGALPFALATWWSVVTPVIALLVLTIGPRAIRPTRADLHAHHRGRPRQSAGVGRQGKLDKEKQVFNNVIVGVDEQPGGRDAIALAKDLVVGGGELTLAHVHLGDPGFVRSSSVAFEEAEQQRSLALLEAVRESTDVEAGHICVGSSSVGRGLHELAERQQADLLVVGSCRRGLIGRVFVGDDTREGLNGAPCAVAVAPAGYADQPSLLREIGVGYNRSPESQRALAVAQELAAERGAKLSAFEAVAIPAYVFGSDAGAVAESIPSYVDQARDRIAALGGVEPHATYGMVAEELALYSASLDLLVVGSRGYGPIGRLVHGSTSQKLAGTARCPLLVLTRGAQAQDASSPLEDGRHLSGSQISTLTSISS